MFMALEQFKKVLDSALKGLCVVMELLLVQTVLVSKQRRGTPTMTQLAMLMATGMLICQALLLSQLITPIWWKKISTVANTPVLD